MLLDQITDIENLTDEEVLQESFDNPDVFSFLVKKYEAPFVRKVRTVLRKQEDIEDVVQETFTKIYLHGKRFKPVEGASFKSWAYRILMNTAFTKYRKVVKEMSRTIELAPEHYEQLSDDVHKESFHVESSDYVVSIFAKMPDHLARVLELHFIKDLPQDAIAEKENMSVGAVKARVHRAKAYFRELAEQYSPY